MYKKVILLVSIMAVLTSCNETKKEKSVTESIAKNKAVAGKTQENEGYTLMKNSCYACHNPKAKSHDDIIAPPFKAVKKNYAKKNDNKKDFVNAVVNWVQNPTEDKALMLGAVKRFKVMPKLPLPTEDLNKIAEYLYDNEVEKPDWMDAHMKEMQGKGMGKGKGKNRKNN